MPYCFYITPEEYEAAEQNGISAETLTRRIRDLAWDKQIAISTPPRGRRDLSYYHKLAEANGIPHKTFTGRMRRIWDPERAATQPVAGVGQITEMLNKRWDTERIYPKEYVELAERNGIQYRTFQWRMRHGWTLEDAAGVKKLTPEEVGSRGYSKSWWKIGPSIFANSGRANKASINYVAPRK